MEVKIGIQQAQRELSIETDETAEQVQQQVEAATVETPQKCEAPEHHQGSALQHDQTLTAATG